jgi:hypothetical protein
MLNLTRRGQLLPSAGFCVLSKSHSGRSFAQDPAAILFARVIGHIVWPGRTQLTAVERDGHWTVRITWPNGASHRVGRYAERREADNWIAEHDSMTAERIEESDITAGKWKARSRKQADSA